MELRQVRYFVAVAEEANVTAAARKLHVSQPPVTRQMRQLEAELGGDLFVRSVRGVELTAIGEAFLPEARKLLAQVTRALERGRAAARGEIGNLDIGYFGSSIYTFIPSALYRFRESWPGVAVSLFALNKTEQVEGLREGRLHLGLARYYPYEPDLVAETVAEEPLLLACPQGSALARRRRIRLADVREERLVLFPREGRPSFADEIISRLSAVGVSPHVAQFAEDVTSALAATAAGVGPTFVPASVAALAWPGVDFVMVDDASPALPIMCLRPIHASSPVVDAFMDALRAEGAALAASAQGPSKAARAKSRSSSRGRPTMSRAAPTTVSVR